jgi:hypothetical protein
MKPPLLGTILPTAASEAASDRHYEQTERDKRTVAAAHPVLSRITPTQYGGENCYFTAPDRYAIVSRSLRVLWFERRADGHWYATRQAA